MSDTITAPALAVSGLDVVYRVRGIDRPVLRGVSFTIERGLSYGLVGESGCGKSTAALAIIRYLPRNGRVLSGSVEVGGLDALALRGAALRRFHARTVSMVYQNPGAALNPSMHEAWNYLGYTNRKLGKYDAALAAYDRALALKPGYAEAIEYRGHAYLGLNRLGEAKDAYLSLFGSNRKLAAQLLAGMQAWVGEHRDNPGGVDGASLEAFASWVSERSSIAGQTAGLTREGASAAW